MINTVLNPTFILVIFWIWLISLSFIVFRMVRHYNRLMHGSANQSLREVLEGLMAREQQITKRIKEAENGLLKQGSESRLHISRLGIVRFNPFEDTGGAQSFTLAILDSTNSGIVMTSLYARNTNRWYIKEIVEGKGKKVELSKEENLAIAKACGIS